MNRKISIKRNYNLSATILILSLLFPFHTFAASIERADQEDIKILLNAASGTNSAFWASLIGETRGHVYIEYTTAVHLGSSFSNNLKHIVYWLPRKELNDEDFKKFKEYKEKFKLGVLGTLH